MIQYTPELTQSATALVLMHSIYYHGFMHTVGVTQQDKQTTYITVAGGYTVRVQFLDKAHLRTQCKIQSTRNAGVWYEIDRYATRNHHCQCPGYHFHHTCTHIDATREALQIVRHFLCIQKYQQQKAHIVNYEAWEELLFEAEMEAIRA